MGFMHNMTCRTDGIARTAPVRWRSLDALCAVSWEAEGKTGATGFYQSPDPRVMLFFNDVSGQISMSDRALAQGGPHRPLLRALYVPAGLPMWTWFHADHRFAHLDLHLKAAWLQERLALSLGAAEAGRVLRRPVEVQDPDALLHIGEALRAEIARPPRHPLVLETLALALVSGLLDLPAPLADAPPSGGLTPAQLRKLNRLVQDHPSQRIPLEVMAETAGLSKSWFSAAFRKSTGLTPLHWQQQQRVEMAKQVLLSETVTIADVSDRLGFADQAHLTRIFRRHTGTTPAVWLRQQAKR